MRRFLGIAAACLMVLAACSGDDDDEAGSGDGAGGDPRTQEYVDAVSAQVQEDEETPVSPEKAGCMAEAIVGAVGVDVLTEAGITPEELGGADDLASLDVDLSDDTADRLGAALTECDLGEDIRGVLVDSFSGGAGVELPADASGCLSDDLSDEAVAGALAGTFVDGSGDHVEELLLAAFTSCPSVMSALLVSQMPDLPPAVEECVGAFVEDNPDLMAEGFTSGSSAAGEEMGTALAAACPELATVGP